MSHTKVRLETELNKILKVEGLLKSVLYRTTRSPSRLHSMFVNTERVHDQDYDRSPCVATLYKSETEVPRTLGRYLDCLHNDWGRCVYLGRSKNECESVDGTGHEGSRLLRLSPI